jgi:2-polyprenyl-3-methyl-5-hydroxy-6-metoxy-1,4-benzoquinol methylase
MTNDTTTPFSLWGIGPLDASLFSPEDWAYLQGLPAQVPPVQWLWQAMDEVWSQQGLNNIQPLAGQPIGAFYSHPVWLANGLFSQADPVSANHRSAVARRLATRGLKRVADFGGGFGELAVRIATEDPSIDVTIVEPYPSRYGQARLSSEPQVSYAVELGAGYDAVIAQDVLEHVEDPIALAHKLASSVKPGGEVIFANCFYPVIQCHLPQTFHLRHTFALHMRAMGLHPVGQVQGAPHIQVFQRGTGKLTLERARRVERLSRVLGPIINAVRS